MIPPQTRPPNRVNTQTLAEITHPRLTTILNNYDFPTQSLSLYNTNIHSLPAHYLLLKEHMQLFSHPPDIITLSDNYLDADTNPNSYKLEGYEPVHTTDVTVYYKHSLFAKILPNVEIPQAASIILQIHSNEQLTNPLHTIISLYRRPHWNPNFPNQLQTTIDTILTKYPRTSITITGDINIDVLRLTPNHSLHEKLLLNNLHTTITTPTRYDPQHDTGTSIDVILTTLTTTDITAGTISPPIADHLATYTILHQPPPRRPENEQKSLSRRYYEKHKTTITREITTAITETIGQTPPAATTSQHFLNIQQTIQRVIETHEQKPKPRRKQWCNPKIKRQIKKQHQLHDRRINNPSPENTRAHATFRQKLKKIIGEAKRKHIEDKLESSKKDPKAQAKILKSIIPGKANSRTSPTVLIYEGKEYTDPTDIANALNDRYITIGHKTSQSIPHYEEEHIMPEREGNEPPPF